MNIYQAQSSLQSGKTGTGNSARGAVSHRAGNENPARNIGNRAWQAKLQFGHSDDKYEREADQVAEKIVTTVLPSDYTNKSVGSSPELNYKPTAIIQRQKEDEVQATDAGQGQYHGQFESDIRNIHGTGNKLDPVTRGYFEPRFGRSLDHILVHTNAAAQNLSQQIHARAFTIGRHITFNTGEYQPTTLEGKRLIAHELTHTFQQKSHTAIQRAPLSEEKKQQLRVTASQYALDDLKLYVEEVEKMSDADAKKMSREVETIRVAGTRAIEEIDKLDFAEKDVYSTFVANLINTFDYEPYAWAHVFGSFKWQMGTQQLTPVELIDRVLAKVKGNPKSVDVEHTRALASQLAYPRQYFLNLLATQRLTEILKAEKIDTKDFYSEDQENKGPGGVFVSPTAKQFVDDVEDESEKELSEEEKLAIGEMDEEKLKLIRELMKQDKSDMDEAKTKLDSLSELELKVLMANALLNSDKKEQSDRIELNMGDVSGVTKGSGMGDANKTMDALKSLEDMIVKGIKSGKGGKKSRFNLSILEEALKALEAEIIMIKGLTKGAARSNPELGNFETELGDAFEELMEAVREDMMKSLGTDLLLSAIPYFGFVNIMRKIKKIVDLIKLIRKVLAIKDEIKNIYSKLVMAKSAFDQVQMMIRKVDEFGQEDVEEKMFELIEQHSLQDILYLPEMDNLSEEEAMEKTLKIIRDIPSGTEHFTQMYSTYSALSSNPSNKELAMLGVEALIAGTLLSPVVAYLALKILENIEAAKTSVKGKTTWDRLTGGKKRKGSKSKKSAKDRQKEKKDKTDKKIKKLDTRDVEYIKSEVENVIKTQYKSQLITAIEDNANSLGNFSWTDAYFKDFVKDQVKILNRKRGGVAVKAWKNSKKSKGAAAAKTETRAPMPSVAVKFNMKTTPWTITLTTRKGKASVSMQPSAAKCKEMSYDSFGGSGIPYDIKVMTGSDKPNKKRRITSWLLHGKQGYQWTYGVDSVGNELRTPDKTFLRMKDGNTKPGFLRVENGFIVKNIDPNAYQHFLGKRLSGQFASRANLRSINKLLPPGYYARKKGGDIIISGKPGAGTTQVLSWDAGLLAVGNATRAPRVVNTNQFDEATDASYDTLSTVVVDQMVDNMFEKDGTGALKSPEKIDNQFKAQGKLTRKKWRDYINSKSDLKKRPKSIDTNLGYTVNVKRKSLSSFDLPELKTSDDKGHLVAARFSGSDRATRLDKFSNLVPMNSAVNQSGAWQDLEREMAQVYIGGKAAPGDYVNLKMTLNYANFVRRPDQIDVTWKHMRGLAALKTKTKHVANP